MRLLHWWRVRQARRTVRVLRVLDDRVSGFQLSRLTAIGPGSLYPLLERLAIDGHITSEKELPHPDGRPRRRYYRATDTGRQHADDLERTFQL